MAADTVRISHKVYEKDQIGEVQIADEVVAIIAGLAATEVGANGIVITLMDLAE